MIETSKKEQLYELIRANPFISQQDLASRLGLSRSAVAGYIAGLIRERRLLGRAYVLPDRRPVLCIGAANIDRKLRAEDSLAMGTSNPARQSESFGGVARNIAENLARLGAPVALTTAVGIDAAGAALLAHAHKLGIDTGATLKLPGASSGTYTAVLDHDGEMAVALADMALYDALTPDFFAVSQQQRANAALVVADLNLPLDAVQALITEAAQGEVQLVIVAVSEPKMNRLPASLHGVRLLILNEGELAARAGRVLESDADIAAACQELRAQGAQDLIVTRGARGVLYTIGDGIEHLPVPATSVVDVTGAGDAFAAAVCWSLHRGDGDLALACRRGVRLSTLTLGCNHTVCPDLTPNSLDDIAGGPSTLIHQD
ncbi:carbohydrate kinase [Massilia horti]|uniref:Winged helix-turn-helix transcriptional regulator n=1 Tax=Massilia horti TaxID=2562153 RepID=A0A4Y9T092_9BURK|nr:carbohydrate kinase [Massilia horti]TFW32441.1 winged helix-turn-helix transcriptional regulator [Massilia horti]